MRPAARAGRSGFSREGALPGKAPSRLAAGPCTVEFSDGTRAPAALHRAGENWELDVAAYRTARGTAIAGRRWRMRAEGDGLKVIARAGD